MLISVLARANQPTNCTRHKVIVARDLHPFALACASCLQCPIVSDKIIDHNETSPLSAAETPQDCRRIGRTAEKPRSGGFWPTHALQSRARSAHFALFRPLFKKCCHFPLPQSRQGSTSYLRRYHFYIYVSYLWGSNRSRVWSPYPTTLKNTSGSFIVL